MHTRRSPTLLNPQPLNPRELAELVVWSTTVYNFALCFRRFHIVAVNPMLRLRELRPGWIVGGMLAAAGAFFTWSATFATLNKLGYSA